MIINYIVASIIGIILGQVVNHLVRRLPIIIEEEKAYKKLIPTLKEDFKLDYKYSLVLIVLFNLLIYFTGSSYISWIYMVIISMLVIAFAIDFKMQLIPDTVQVILLLLGIVITIIDSVNWLNHILGMLIGAGVFLLIALFSKLVFRKEGMGMGDIKLMGNLGLIFGIESLPTSFMSVFSSGKIIFTITVLSFFMAAIVAIILIAMKKTDKGSYLAFGPYIVISTILIMFFGPEPFLDGYFYLCNLLANLVTSLMMKII